MFVLFDTVFYFLFIFLSLISIIGYGVIVSKILKAREYQSFFLHYNFIYGIILIGFISLIFNFFFSFNDIYNIIILLIGLVFFIIFNKHNNLQKFFFLTLLTFSLTYFAGLNDDFDYHFKTILNFKNINLFEIEHDRRISYNSHLLFISSLFTFKNYINGFFILSALLYSVVVFDLFTLKKLGDENEKHIISFFSLFTIVFLIGVINKSKDFGTDIAGFLISIIVIINILRFKFEKNKISSEKIILILLLLCNFAFMIKITNSLIYLYLFMFIFCIKFKLKNLFKFKYFISFLPLLLWLLQNVIISGCIIWPITPLCIYQFGDSKNELYLIESFAKGDINTSMKINLLSWIPVWVSNHSSKILEIYGFFLFVFIFPIIIFHIKNKLVINFFQQYKNYYSDTKILYFFGLTTICNLIWFFYAPAYRFGIFYNLLLLFFILLPFWKNLIIKKDYYKLVSKYLIFIAISFFLFENITKVFEYQDRYGNSWPPIINNILTIK